MPFTLPIREGKFQEGVAVYDKILGLAAFPAAYYKKVCLFLKYSKLQGCALMELGETELGMDCISECVLTALFGS